MLDEQCEAVRSKAGLILWHALGHLQAADEEPDPEQMSRDARTVRALTWDVLHILSFHWREMPEADGSLTLEATAASCFDRICKAAEAMQSMAADEGFRLQCITLATFVLQATRQIEDILVASGVPTAIVSEEPGADFYIPESGTEAESGAITAPTRTAGPGDAFIGSATDGEGLEQILEGHPMLAQEPREGQILAQVQRLENQLQDQTVEHGGELANLAATLHNLGYAKIQEGEAEGARQALDYLHQSLQMKRCLHQGADHLSIARTLHELGRASSILENREEAQRYFLESLHMSRRLHGSSGHGEIITTLYSLSNEHFLCEEFQQAQRCLEEALHVAESLWPGYMDDCSDTSDTDGSSDPENEHQEPSDVSSDGHGSGRHPQDREDRMLWARGARCIEAGDDWADNLRELLRGQDLEFCRILNAAGKVLTVLPSADSADLEDTPLPEDFPLQVWLEAPGIQDRWTLSSVLHLLAQMHGENGDFQAAANLFQKSLLVAGCLADHKDHESKARSLHEWGRICHLAQDFSQAVCCLEEALRMKRSVYGDQDTASVAKTLGLLGQVMFDTGELDHAKQFLVESLQMQRSVHRTGHHLDVSFTLRALSQVCSAGREYEQCISYLWECLEIQQAVPCKSVDLAQTHMALGDAFNKTGDYDQCKSCLCRALRILREARADENRPDLALCLHALGQVTSRCGDVNAGIDLLGESLRIQRALYPDEDRQSTAVTLGVLGQLWARDGDLWKASRCLQESLRILRSVDPEGSSNAENIVNTERLLSRVLVEAKRIESKMLALALTCIGCLGLVAAGFFRLRRWR
ncbi:Nphp3 [Symbiodinium sp. CCMP2456]|nr:Nphp3 [Symbiodinium sp. CCMP2456]